MAVATARCGCVRGEWVGRGPRDSTRYSNPQIPKASPKQQPKVPPAYRPPQGMCRIWIDGVPPDQQPAPTDCVSAVRNRPANGTVIFGDDAPKKGETQAEKEENGLDLGSLIGSIEESKNETHQCNSRHRCIRGDFGATRPRRKDGKYGSQRFAHTTIETATAASTTAIGSEATARGGKSIATASTRRASDRVNSSTGWQLIGSDLDGNAIYERRTFDRKRREDD